MIDLVIFSTIQNRDVSSRNNFGLGAKSSFKSLMCIRKNNRPSREPFGTPASTEAHEEHCPLWATLCYRWYKKDMLQYVIIPDILFSLG